MLRLLAPCLLVAGCARASAPPPPRYEPLPASSEATAAFRPAPQLSALPLACRDQELPYDNGLDDNCDGIVDAPAGSRSEVRVHVAQVGGPPLELAIAAAETPSQRAARTEAQQDTPYRVTRFTLPTLAQGPHRLSLQHPAPTASAEEISLSIAVEGPSGVQTYLTRLAPAEETLLGELVQP